jgi:hypothetical protein
MSAQFVCQNQNRLQQLREFNHLPSGPLPANPINAIDFLEVLDEKAFAGTSPQQTLLVCLLLPAPATLNEHQVRIDGGVRTTSINVLWAQAATALTKVPSAEADFYRIERAQALGVAPENILVVRSDVFGDFSSYTLSFVDKLSTDPDTMWTPPAGFDLKLSRVEFSFKVQCPTDFDCGSAPVCAPLKAPAPAIDYQAKDYASFRRVMLDRLSVIMPDWLERNPADLGVALVELVAYQADYLSYYQDAVATEAYLGTSRQRVSARRHARLLDYAMHEGTNARAWLAIDVTAEVTLARQRPDPSDPTKTLPTACLTNVGLAPRMDLAGSGLLNLVRLQQPQVFELMHDARLHPQHRELDFYTWQDDNCCLPKGATRATLAADTASPLQLVAGDALILQEALGRDTGLRPDADPTRRQAVRLIKVAPQNIDPLTGQAYVEVEWHPEDALAFPLCLSTKIVDPATGVADILVTNVSTALGNVVLVDHGFTRASEQLVPSDPSTVRRYRPKLTWPGVTHGQPYDHTRTQSPQPDGSLPLSATATLAQDPKRSAPFISVGDAQQSELWSARPDLLESAPFARDFVAELDDDGFATLRFGDGVDAAEPEANLRATYRSGRGRSGNVGADAIAHINYPDPAITRVRNPLPAFGGVDPETLAQVQLYAPQAFRTQERAVTEADYATIAARFQDVMQARAQRRWTGSWYTVFVTVERAGGRPVDAAFKAQLAAYLERYRLAGEDLEVEAPILVPLQIQLVVCVKAGYFRDVVQSALLTAFSSTIAPDGTRGFFFPDNFTFGQPVYLSALVGRTMQVDGVDWVDADGTNPSFLFQRFGLVPNGEIAAGLIKMDRLEIARCDNSASLPENGKIGFVMLGGQ